MVSFFFSGRQYKRHYSEVFEVGSKADQRLENCSNPVGTTHKIRQLFWWWKLIGHVDPAKLKTYGLYLRIKRKQYVEPSMATLRFWTVWEKS